MFGSIRVCVPVNIFFCLFISVYHIFEYIYFYILYVCLFTCMCMLLRHLRVA